MYLYQIDIWPDGYPVLNFMTIISTNGRQRI